MLADLEALTPPLIVGGAFLIGVVLFLRQQMAPRHEPADDRDAADIAGSAENADPVDPGQASSAGEHKV